MGSFVPRQQLRHGRSGGRRHDLADHPGDASNVVGLEYQDNTVLTGTSENVNINENASFLAAQQSAGYNTVTEELPMIGGIYVAWKGSPGRQ